LAALALTQCRVHRRAVRVALLLAETHVIKLSFTIRCISFTQCCVQNCALI